MLNFLEQAFDCGRDKESHMFDRISITTCIKGVHAFSVEVCVCGVSCSLYPTLFCVSQLPSIHTHKNMLHVLDK